MKYSSSKPATAIAQLIACLALVACGGGNPGASQSEAESEAAPASDRVHALAVGSAGSGLGLDLVSATGGVALPFTLGQALRQGDVPTGQAVVSDASGFQFVVKNRWPDGSAKFAIMSGRADMSANTWKTIGLSVAAAPAPGVAVATSDIAGMTASVQYGAFGTAQWNAGDWASPVQNWVSGPEMSAFTYRKPIGGDAHLVAWLEVRAYKGGRVEVLPWIENGYLKVGGPTSKSGTASFTLGGTQRFSQPLTLLNHQRAVLASGTTLTHWYGGSDPQVTPRHSAAYLMATKLVPNYRGVTSAGSALFARLPSSYTPLMQGSFATDMGATGYDAGIGLLPEWDVAYLTSGGDPRALRAVLINGYAAGRYGTHYRDESTNRPLKLSSYPNLVMGNGSGVAFTGASSTNSYTPDATGVAPPTYDSPHHPSMGYMAYLLSGWNYYLEETQLLATANFLKQTDTTRQYAAGVLVSNAGANVTRGAAWAMRTLAQATALTPDSDSLHAEFAASVDQNVTFYNAKYVAQANNPLGFVQPYDHYTSTDPWQATAWMDDFFTASWGFMKDLAVNTAPAQAKLDAFLAWKYGSVVGRLGSGAAGTFNYRYAAASYTMNYAPSNTANWDSGSGPWYANWAAEAASLGVPLADGGTSLQGSSGADPSVMAGGYWGNLHPALAYAVDHGAPGAAAAYNRLTSASNYSPSQFNDSPVWGVTPRGP